MTRAWPIGGGFEIRITQTGGERMSDYPDRIIARIDFDGDVDGQWLDASAPKPHSFGHYFGEFIRLDLHEAAVAAARAEGMREAFEKAEEAIEAETMLVVPGSIEEKALAQAWLAIRAAAEASK